MSLWARQWPHRVPYRLEGQPVNRLPDPVRRALRLFLWTFLGIFSVTLTGWLGSVVEWASTSDQAFPGLTPLGKAAVAATAAAASAVVAYVVNALEDRGTVPAVLKAPASDGAKPAPDQAGYSVIEVLVAVFLVLVILFVLVRLL